MSRQKLVDLDVLQQEPKPSDTGGSFFPLPDGDIAGLLVENSPAGIVQAAFDGKLVHFATGGKWSLHQLLEEALKRMPGAELFFSTYSITEFSARQLSMALDAGKLSQVHILLDYRAKVRYPEVYQLACNLSARIRLTPVHAKVLVLRTADRCFTMMGSANWTENPRIEVGFASCNPAAANFHINWLNKALDTGQLFGDE